MRGEKIDHAQISVSGVLGDRAFALVDGEDGKVASAKNPRKWPDMFDFEARYVEEPSVDSRGVIGIQFGDGRSITTRDEGIDAIFSATFGRPVHLASQPPSAPQFECFSVQDPDQADPEVVTVNMPKDTFFDSCVLHVLTTATLRQLGSLYPEGQFDVRRFRPNIVIDTGEAEGFVENDWVGRTIKVGEQVVLKAIEPCTRCIMTTLPQSELPKDVGILRTVAKNNASSVGVRVAVLRGGVVQNGDAVTIE
jgi:uncharacterized protein YcbX